MRYELRFNARNGQTNVTIVTIGHILLAPNGVGNEFVELHHAFCYATYQQSRLQTMNLKAQQYDKRKASPGTIQMATNGDTDCSYLVHCRDGNNEKEQSNAKQGAY